MAERSIEDVDRVRRRIVNVVGHELRTPITTLRGLAEILATAEVDEIRSTIAPAILRTARRTEELLDDLLLAAGVSTVATVMPARSLDLRACVTDVVAGADVVVDHGGDRPTVTAQYDEVVHALRHLLDNALRYGDGPPMISVEAGDSDATVRVRCAVTAQVPDLDLAFELFYRGERAVTEHAGLGVGLPVARELARRNGGEVVISQEPGSITSCLVLPAS